MSEQDVNQQTAEGICNGCRWNGQEFRVGEYVALRDGKVVAIAADLASALTALRSLDANAKRGMVFEVRPILADVIR